MHLQILHTLLAYQNVVLCSGLAVYLNMVCSQGLEPLANQPTLYSNGFTDRRQGRNTNLLTVCRTANQCCSFRVHT